MRADPPSVKDVKDVKPDGEAEEEPDEEAEEPAAKKAKTD